MQNIKTKITQIHYQRDPKGILFNLLKFCSYFYGFASRLKNFCYDKKLIKPKRVNAFVISVTRTLLQSVLSVFCTCMLAYALSRKEYVLRKPLTSVLVVSMYGLAP